MTMTVPKPPMHLCRLMRLRCVRTAALLVLCIFTFASNLTSAQSQNTTREDPTIHENRQPGPPRPILDTSSFIIVEDPNRLGDLFERLDTPDFQIIRPQKSTAEKSSGVSTDTFVKSIVIKGKVIGSIADLTIVMEIQQSKAGTLSTSIGLDGLVLRSVRSGGTAVAASVPRPGGPWQVQTGAVGTHRIEIELGTEITSDRTTRRFALSIPEAASTELAIEVPEQVLFASTNARDSLQSRFDSVRNLYTITGLLTPRSRLELRWLGQSLIRNEDRIRLECRGQISVRMELDAVSTRQTWQIRPLTGLPEKLSFEIPADEALLDIFVDGQATRPSFEKNGSGNAIVHLDNPFSSKGPNSDPISVELVTRQAYPAKSTEIQNSSREFTWRAPRWNYGEIVTGIVALEMPERWVLSNGENAGFEPVDLRDLSDRLRKSTNQAALRFSGMNSEIRFRIRRRQPPLFTDVRTIGIVRRSQTEYVSDIIIQGEIDPLKEYEIELDRAARPLFIGPRDVWERYEIVGETVRGDRKFHRLRLTPNRAFKPETAATLRIRYLRRTDSPDMFSICLPRFLESTGESYRTWLLPEPSLAIEPIDSTQPIRRRLPPQDTAVFTNLLEQSIGDDDKWIKPRNAGDAYSVFFRFANPSDKNVSFRTFVRPANLDCIQHLVLRPNGDAVGIRHIFDCSIDKGTFERIIVTPSAKNPIRNLRYTLSHEGTDRTGNLIIQDGGFEIPLTSDIPRQFTLTLETVLAWPERQNSPNPQADPSIPNAPFDASKYDFSIADAKLLLRRFTIEDSIDSLSSIENASQAWQSSKRIAESETETVRTWTAVNASSEWPVFRTFPLVSRSDPVADFPIREIRAVTNSSADARLYVAYRLAAKVKSLQLSRIRNLNIESATFEGQPVNVALTGDTWSVTIPSSHAFGTLVVKYRSDQPISVVRIPLPPKLDGASGISTWIQVHHSNLERLLPPWRSGWTFETEPQFAGFDDFGFGFRSGNLSKVLFSTDDPRLVLPIRRVPVVLLMFATFIVAAFCISIASLLNVRIRSEIQAISLIAIAASLASDQIEVIWAVSVGLGILFGSFIIRQATLKFTKSEMPGIQSANPVILPNRGSEVSTTANSRSKLGSKEPSTVLKRMGPQEIKHLESTSDESGPEVDSSKVEEPARWSLALEEASDRSGSRSRPGTNDSAEALS